MYDSILRRLDTSFAHTHTHTVCLVLCLRTASVLGCALFCSVSFYEERAHVRAEREPCMTLTMANRITAHTIKNQSLINRNALGPAHRVPFIFSIITGLDFSLNRPYPSGNQVSTWITLNVFCCLHLTLANTL